jgi:hypothetical protein
LFLRNGSISRRNNLFLPITPSTGVVYTTGMANSMIRWLANGIDCSMPWLRRTGVDFACSGLRWTALLYDVIHAHLLLRVLVK